MSPRQRHLAIAKALGWKNVSFGVGHNRNLCLGDKPTWHRGNVVSYLVDQRVPDFIGELEASEKHLLNALVLMRRHYEDLSKSNPGFMGKLVLQDYGLWNRALLAMDEAITKAAAKN